MEPIRDEEEGLRSTVRAWCTADWSGSHTLAARAERRQTRCGVQRGQCGEPCWFGHYSGRGGAIR